MDNIIQPSNKRTPLEKMLKYFKASYNSPSTPHATRIAYMLKYGYMEMQGASARFKDFTKLESDAAATITALRGDDPDLPIVLTELTMSTF
ncbi:hypothetical protein CBL_10023 [Carabus blaptoides fortunei]